MPAELPGLFSSAGVMSLGVGPALEPDGIRGYAIDMRVKAQEPWPPRWQQPVPRRLWIATIQYGIGAHERWLDGDGDEWLEAAVACADEVLAHLGADGRWEHGYDYPHTFALPAGWISAIAQGEGASFLVRMHQATGREEYGAGARAALHPMTIPNADGGCLALVGGGPFPDEYPTRPPSHVLNGGMFAMWGFRDVAVAQGDEHIRGLWEDMVATLRDNVHRWDTGWWSRYDLFPGRPRNIASSFYHDLHVNQLRAMALLTGEGAFTATADRWAGYEASRANRARAFAAKAAFRLAVPRNRLFARRRRRG